MCFNFYDHEALGSLPIQVLICYQARKIFVASFYARYKCLNKFLIHNALINALHINFRYIFNFYHLVGSLLVGKMNIHNVKIINMRNMKNKRKRRESGNKCKDYISSIFYIPKMIT
jgi:hypothetical protein